MSVMNMIEALNDAHDVMMARDENIVVFGEDVGYFGGVFRVTAGLQEKYGKTRVFDAPIAEGGIIGTALGLSTGWTVVLADPPSPGPIEVAENLLVDLDAGHASAGTPLWLNAGTLSDFFRIEPWMDRFHHAKAV